MSHTFFGRDCVVKKYTHLILTLHVHAVRCSNSVTRCAIPLRWSLLSKHSLQSTATTLCASSSLWKEPRTWPAASCTDISIRLETVSSFEVWHWGNLELSLEIWMRKCMSTYAFHEAIIEEEEVSVLRRLKRGLCNWVWSIICNSISLLMYHTPPF